MHWPWNVHEMAMKCPCTGHEMAIRGLYKLQGDTSSVFSFFVNDVVEFCIEPYLKYEFIIENIFGFNADERIKHELSDNLIKKIQNCFRSSAVLIGHCYRGATSLIPRAIAFFENHNKLNLEQIHNLRTFDDIDSYQLRSLYLYRLLRDSHGFFPVPSDEFCAKNSRWYNDVFGIYSLESKYIKKQLEAMPKCTICRSVTHSDGLCPVFEYKTYLRCEIHGLDHFLIRRKKVHRTDVPHAEKFIAALRDGYKHCHECQL